MRSQASIGEFQQTLEELQRRSKEAGKERYLHGVCVVQVSDVRYENNTRFLCVYDTPLAGKPYHADIMGPLIAGDSKSQVKRNKYERYKKLIEVIESTLTAPDQFKNGALSPFARLG